MESGVQVPLTKTGIQCLESEIHSVRCGREGKGRLERRREEKGREGKGKEGNGREGKGMEGSLNIVFQE